MEMRTGTGEQEAKYENVTLKRIMSVGMHR
jgi:hypothetical protein